MTTSIQKSCAIASLFVGAMIGLSGQVMAAEKLSITLDTPPGHVRNVWIGKFADALQTRSNGEIEVEIFDSGQLYSSRDAGKAVARGDAGMAIVSTAALAQIEANLNALDLPMFSGMTTQQKNEVVDGPLGQELARMTADKMGVVVPGGWYILGALDTYSKDKVIASYSDLEDVQVRIPGSASWIAMFKSLGAAPVNLPFTDVPLALQQGTVDAMVSSNLSVISAKLHESGLKNAFVNNLGVGYYMPIVSLDFWDSLSAEQQTLFKATWGEFVQGQRDAAVASQIEARDTLQAAGMVFHSPTEADFAQTRATFMELQPGLIADLGISQDIMKLAEQAVK